MEFKGVVSMEFYKPFQRNSTGNGFLWKSMETFPCNSMELTKDISMEFHGSAWRDFRGISWNVSMEFHGNCVLILHGIPWNFFPWKCMDKFP